MRSLPFFPEPGPDEARIRALARKFSEEHLRPQAISDDHLSRFRRSAFDEAARLGLTSLLIPKEYGGGATSHHCHYAVLEELARASLAFSITCGVTNLVKGAILNFGSPAQRREILPAMTAGKCLGGFSLSEPGSGSDSASLRLAAKKVSGGYRLTGTKCWCTNGGDADIYLVFARTGEHRTKGISAFLVDKNTAGFHTGKLEHKMGLKASALAELVFEDAFIPEEKRVGQEGQGLTIALAQLEMGRIGIGVSGFGISCEAIERVWKSGVVLSDATKHSLAESHAHLQAMKSLIHTACERKDRGLEIGVLGSHIKLLATELAMRITSEAVVELGYLGYTREFEVERLMRDAKALQIVEGTNQIQRLVIARHLEECLA